MSKRLLEHDPVYGRTSYLHTDSVTGDAVIESVQDCEDIVKFNAAAAEIHNPRNDWWFIGSIPLEVCMQWALESNTKPFTKPWQKYAKKQIQLPEYRKLNPNNIKL